MHQKQHDFHCFGSQAIHRCVNCNQVKGTHSKFCHTRESLLDDVAELQERLRAAEFDLEMCKGEKFNIESERDTLQVRVGEMAAEVERLNGLEAELLSVLPKGAEFLDPPDGGSVSPIEQVKRIVAEVERLNKTNSTDVKLGPDGKEWAKTAAGYAHVESVKNKADADFRWKGYVVREAFVAGAEWQENRKVNIPLEKVEGDLLPPIGSKVKILLGISLTWIDCTVTGYYVWGDLQKQDHLHRVFVRVADENGIPNARLLKDVRWER